MTEHSSEHPVNSTLFEQRLQPHRSLKASHFKLLMLLLCAISTATTIPFFLLGAWPIIGFMGLDVLLIYVAFRASYNSAKAYETVRLDVVSLKIEKVSAKGVKRAFSFNPLWVRLGTDEDEDYGMRRLFLRVRSREVELGKFLTAQERADFAKKFRPALAQAQRGPMFDHGF